MSNSNIQSRLAVCSWSLQPTSPSHLIEQMKQIGINKLQCAIDPVRENPAVWGNLAELCAQNGMSIVSGMFGTVGEDYSTLESIRRTGGLVPDATWEQNWQDSLANVQIAKKMGLKLITFHAGFLPHEPSHPDFNKLIGRIRQVTKLYADNGLELALETGQETAATLKDFLEQLDQPNVGINFDPANMILYDKDNPIDALRQLGPWLRQCHIKDAIRTKQPGVWGQEVVVGTGEVDWPAFFGTLAELKFSGYCCIEREAGIQRVEDIRTARQRVEEWTAKT